MAFDSSGTDSPNATSQQARSSIETILPEETKRTSGRTAMDMNITAGKALAEAVRSTLGPDGLDKMLVDSNGSVVVTNSGSSILHEMDIDHPIALLVREVAASQAESVGDGTTAAVILTGELLSQAENLLETDLHPSIITRGYSEAVGKIQEYLADISSPPDEPREHLLDIARSSLTGRGVLDHSDPLAEVVVNAVIDSIGSDGIDTSRIEIVGITGRSVSETGLINGIVIESPPGLETIEAVDDISQVALIDGELNQTQPEVEYSVSNLETYSDLRETVERRSNTVASTIEKFDIDLVVSTEDIDPDIRASILETGCAVVDTLDEATLSQLKELTTAMPVQTIQQVTSQALWEVRSVGVQTFGSQDHLLIEGSSDESIVTIVCCGETDHVVNSVKEAIEDTVAVVAHSLIAGQTVAGGGATHIEIAKRLREHATSVSGKQQLAIEAFADSLEVIPRVLAENAGHDPIDTLLELRSYHDIGKVDAGVASDSGTCRNMRSKGVVAPRKGVQNAIVNATESARLILRIDDVISAGSLRSKNDTDPAETDTPDLNEKTALSSPTIQGSVASTFETITVQEMMTATSDSFDISDTGSLSTQSISQSSGQEAIASLSTPSWVPPRSKFPMRLQWSGIVNSILINHENTFEVTEVIGGEPQVSTELGRTKIKGIDLGENGNLLIYFNIKTIPPEEVTLNIPVELQYESGNTISKNVSLTVNRALISVDVTNQLSSKNLTQGIDVALQNLGSLGATVTVDATAAGESVVMPGGAAWNLLNGLLNIGIHMEYSTDRSDSNVSGGLHRLEDITLSETSFRIDTPDYPEYQAKTIAESNGEDDSKELYQRCCKDVLALLHAGVRTPEAYNQDDLTKLQNALQKMLRNDDFSLLRRHLNDIKLAYLEGFGDQSLQGSIHLSTPLEAFSIPSEAEKVQLEIQYEDTNGTTYEPINESITVGISDPEGTPQTVPVTVRSKEDD